MGNSNSSVAEEPSESAVANETIPAAEGASPVQRTDGHDMNIAINLDDIFSQPEHAEGSNRNLYGHNPSLGQVTANEDNEVIHLSKLPKSVSTQLQFLDRDGDGTIDIEEIRRLIASNERNKSEKRIYRGIFIAAIIGWFVTIGVIGACVYLINEKTKESHVTNSVLTDAMNSNNPVQCANTDLIVTNGVAHPRSDLSNAPTNTSRLISGNVADALGVRNEYKQIAFSSTLPDEYFKELHWFEVVSSTGLKLSFKVLGLSRFLTKQAKCGTLLKIVTAAGVLVLDDEDLYYDTDLYSLFTEAGFQLSHGDSLADTTNPTRKLQGRKLTTTDGSSISLVGFFNAINNYDWKCDSVPKPNIPDAYYIKGSNMVACETNGNCSFPAPNDVLVPHFGITTIANQQFLPESQEIFAEADGSNYIIRRPQYHPGVTAITAYINNNDGTFTSREYQISEDGTYSHCSEDPQSVTSGAAFPSNFIFYPLDDEPPTSHLIHFRISIKNDDPEPLKQLQAFNGIAVPEWHSMDYFEDKHTKEPAVIIATDGSVFNVENFTSASNRPVFAHTGLFSSDKFRRCLAVTATWVNHDFEHRQKFFTNGSYAAAVAIGNVSTALQNLYQSWNWTQSYPPLIRAMTRFSPLDVKYYMSVPMIAKRHPLWAAYVQKYYARLFPADAMHRVNVTNARRIIAKSMREDPRYQTLTMVHEDELSDEFPYHALVREEDIAYPHHHHHHHDHSSSSGLNVNFDGSALEGRALTSTTMSLPFGAYFVYDLSVPSFNLYDHYYKNGKYAHVDITLSFSDGRLNFVADMSGCIASVLCFEGYLYFPRDGGIRVYIDLSPVLPSAITVLCPFCNFQIDLFTASIGATQKTGSSTTWYISDGGFCGDSQLFVTYTPLTDETIFPDKQNIPIPIPIAAIAPYVRGTVSVFTDTFTPDPIGGFIAFKSNDNYFGDTAFANYADFYDAFGQECVDWLFDSSGPVGQLQASSLATRKTVSLVVQLGLECKTPFSFLSDWKALGSPITVLNHVF